MRSAVFHTRLYGNKTALNVSDYHLMEREVSGCCLTVTAHPPQLAIPRHAHNCASFFLVVQGSLTEEAGTTRWDCRPSSFVLTPPGAVHADVFHDQGGRLGQRERPISVPWHAIHSCLTAGISFSSGCITSIAWPA
jgi:hypothetical protein